MNKGERVAVGMCDYTESPKRWVPGTVVAVCGPTLAIVLDDPSENNGVDWIGSICYVRPE